MVCEAQAAWWRALTFATSMLALLGFMATPAEAQREVVEDSWTQAEAAMADGHPADAPAPSRLGAPGDADDPPARPARVEDSAWEQTVDRLLAGAARARTPFGGPLRVDLVAPRGLRWSWLGEGSARPPNWMLHQPPRLCTGACTLHVTPGTFRFGVRAADMHRTVYRVVDISSSGTIEAHYQSRHGWRRGGIALMVVGTLTLAVMLAALIVRDVRKCPFFPEDECRSPPTPLYVKIGAPIGAAMLAAGIVLTVTGNRRLTLEFRQGFAL